MTTELILPVPTEELLAALQDAPLPLDLREAARESTRLRETYFDTSDYALHGRHMTLRVRRRAAGPATIVLSERGGSASAPGLWAEMETASLGSGLYETLCGESELSSRVREIVEPTALRPRVAMDIERTVRTAKPRLISRAELAFCYDRVSVQVAGIAQRFQEIGIRRLREGEADFAAVARDLAERWGIEPDGMDTLRRGLAVLDQVRTRMVERSAASGQAAVVALRGTDMALAATGEGLTVPTTIRSPQDAPARMVASVLGGEAGGIEPLGLAPERRPGDPVEVWLATDVEDAAGGLTWFPVHELMERAGAPGLRDPALISALLLLSRSQRFRSLPLPRRSDEDRPLVPVSSGASREADSAAPDPQHLLNPELSELAFNGRVLSLASDPSVPLLERVRFLSIFSSNLDEFFGVRVAAVKRRVRRHAGRIGEDGLLPRELLDLIGIRVRVLSMRLYRLLFEELVPGLEREGIRILDWDELDEARRQALTAYFDREVFPLLTPRAMTMAPGHPFPHVSSQGLSLAAVLSREGQRDHLAHIRVPDSLPRFLPVPDSPDVIPLEDVITANSQTLFPGHEVSAHLFRVVRSGDYELEEEEAESMLEAVEKVVRKRPYHGVVRIEVHASMPSRVRGMLLRELRAERDDQASLLDEDDLYEVEGPLDLRGLVELADLPRAPLRFPPFRAADPFPGDASIFDILKRGDRLVHHPYEDFERTVGRLLGEAAEDPDVVSIKLTLYRTGTRSPVVDALLAACKRDKEVTAFVELKARWDEERNIAWTRRLTEAGVHVVSGVVHHKTHAKTALVVRREAGGLRRYVHIGTGNYNAATARFYTDLGLLSADEELGADLSDLFNALTGTSQPPMKQYRKILVAPHTLLPPLLMRIEREMGHARAGRPARIQAKLNGLDDSEVVHALYRASQAGVDVDLIVRGLCTLRPGVEGLSDRIRVTSVLGRFLEHSRICYFENGGASEYFIGSADWRSRNLRRRIEVVAPVEGQALRGRLRRILDTELADPRAWELRADGVYVRRSGDAADTAQQQHMARAAERPTPGREPGPAQTGQEGVDGTEGAG